MLDFYRVDQVLGTPETIWGFLGKWVSVGTFVLGIVSSRWFARYDKRRKDKKITEDLLTEIELLEVPMRRQQEAIKDFVEKLRSDKDDEIVFSSAINLNVDRLKALDRSSLADHLEGPMKDRKKAIDVANRILIGCEAITGKYREAKSTVQDHAMASKDIRKRCHEQVDNFNHLVRGFIADMIRQQKSAKDDPLLSAIDNLSNPQLRRERKDIYDMHEQHFKPLEALLLRYIADPRTSQLMDANRAIHQCVRALKDEQNSTANRLEVIANFMQQDFGYLQSAVGSIPTTK